MVGQKKLLNIISKYTLTTMPKTLLFIGQAGCGKHTLVKQLAEQLALPIEEITTETTATQLIDFQLRTIPYLYLIDLTKVNEKQQNQFLKFIEEPAENVYIALIAESEFAIIPTILSRCVKFTFEEYSAQELAELSLDFGEDQEAILDICRTPGQLLNTDFTKIKTIKQLCLDIFNNIIKANYANLMSLTTKFNYKEEYNKFEPLLFLKMFRMLAYNKYINEETNNSLYFTIGNYTSQYIKELEFVHVSFNENVMIGFFSHLKELFI